MDDMDDMEVTELTDAERAAYCRKPRGTLPAGYVGPKPGCPTG